jgi:hypothetical protein
VLCYSSVAVQSTDHELILARNASLTAMQGPASRSNVRYYPTWKHSPLKERNEQGCTIIQTARCLQLRCESLRLLIADQQEVFRPPASFILPRTALRTFTHRRDQLVICGQCSHLPPWQVAPSDLVFCQYLPCRRNAWSDMLIACICIYMAFPPQRPWWWRHSSVENVKY